MGLNSKGKPCDLHTFERPMRTAEPTIGVNPDPPAHHSLEPARRQPNLE